MTSDLDELVSSTSKSDLFCVGKLSFPTHVGMNLKEGVLVGGFQHQIDAGLIDRHRIIAHHDAYVRCNGGSVDVPAIAVG